MAWRLPETPAIYFVIKPPNIVLYVGQSKNLLNRFKSHNKSRKFEMHCDYSDIKNDPKIYYWACPHLLEEERIEIEYVYINKLDPLYNISGTFKDNVQNYARKFWKIFINLESFLPRETIIEYINKYSFGAEKKQFSSLGLLGQVFFSGYDILHKDELIIYNFSFGFSKCINQDLFKDVFISTLSKNYLLPEEVLQVERIEIKFEIKTYILKS